MKVLVQFVTERWGCLWQTEFLFFFQERQKLLLWCKKTPCHLWQPEYKGSGPRSSHKHQLEGSCKYMPHLPPSKKMIKNNYWCNFGPGMWKMIEFFWWKMAFHPWPKKKMIKINYYMNGLFIGPIIHDCRYTWCNN